MCVKLTARFPDYISRVPFLCANVTRHFRSHDRLSHSIEAAAANTSDLSLFAHADPDSCSDRKLSNSRETEKIVDAKKMVFRVFYMYTYLCTVPTAIDPAV